MVESKTNSYFIRSEAQAFDHNHTNRWWQNHLLIKYKRKISIQQIAAVLGRYRDRVVADRKVLHDNARKYLLSCDNDVELARRILLEYQA